MLQEWKVREKQVAFHRREDLLFQLQGYAETGWFEYKKNTYYANSSGVVSAGKWVTKNKKKYYMKSNGIRAEKEWVKKAEILLL